MEDEIIHALHQDLHKSATEAYATEIGFLYEEINYTLKHLKSWMRPQKAVMPLTLFPSGGKVLRDPLGICLIIAPWNYPFQLLLSPLVGAIAGGNCAVLKPSDTAPHTEAVIAKLITRTFDQRYIQVVTGAGGKVVPKLMEQHRFDLIFFTGSIPTGTSIAKQAAEKLTPVILELGGKSPCIVAENADISVAAKRIAWGKFTNAGQTCVAPDYLLVHAGAKVKLVSALQDSLQQFYGADAQTSEDYGRIINKKQYEKLCSYLKDGHIITGGQTDVDTLYIAPTLLDDVAADAAVMQEEIFGPILPIFTYQNEDEILKFIKSHPDPLSLYVFSNDTKLQERITETVAFGGGCINNTLMHLGSPKLPFGGVCSSGTGQYHGKYSFEAFTRPKSILSTATWLDPKVKYPPYAGKLKWIKRLMG